MRYAISQFMLPEYFVPVFFQQYLSLFDSKHNGTIDLIFIIVTLGALLVLDCDDFSARI